MFGEPSFGLTRKVDRPFAEVVLATRQALAAQGFGVLTEIDLAATMKAKLGHAMRPYVILGACHPPSAWAALSAEPAVGLLLPCNVVVAVDDDERAVVSAIDPAAMFQVVDRPGMDAVVSDVRARLQAAIDAV